MIRVKSTDVIVQDLVLKKSGQGGNGPASQIQDKQFACGGRMECLECLPIKGLLFFGGANP